MAGLTLGRARSIAELAAAPLPPEDGAQLAPADGAQLAPADGAQLAPEDGAPLALMAGAPASSRQLSADNKSSAKH